MSAVVKPDPVASRAPESASYWAVVGGQLRKNRVAMVAWRLILLLVVLAVAAPLLAFNVPLLWIDGAGVRFPLISRLFDRFLFSSGVDVFFNLWLLAVPVWFLAHKTAGSLRLSRARASLWGAALLLVFGVEAWAAADGRSAMSVAVFGVSLLGGALAAAAAAFGPARKAGFRRRLRLAALGVWLVGFGAILLGPADTRPWKDWKRAAVDAPASTVAVFPPVPYHPFNRGEGNLPAMSAPHWIGVDASNQDVLTRLLFGIRISLTIGLVAVGIYITIGTILGGLAGYYGGWVDILISRLLEIMICFPTLFLLLTIVAVLEARSIFMIMAAIGLVGWPGVARLVRGEFLRQRSLDYVTAAKSQGVPERRIIFGHILPNCLGPVLVSATFGIAGAILTESSLAFLGLGDKEAPSWGEMLTNGRESLRWHLILAPGIAIFFVVSVFNLLGEGLRDALDPKLRR